MNILKSKLQIPIILKDWIDRERLTDLYTDSSKIRLIVNQAPAGFGKTTITRQFLEHQRKTKAAWIHLDSLDDDPKRFIRYLFEALFNIYPSLKNNEIEKAIDNPTITELQDNLFFMLEELNHSTGWLVLDNWEKVDHSQSISELVQRLIALTDSSLKLIINTRKPLSIKTGKLVSEKKAILLTEKDLAFNLYECESLIKKTISKTVDSDILDQIWQATLGWCVSVNLYLQRIADDEQFLTPKSMQSRENQTLNLYIDEEILSCVNHKLFDFIIRCSVLDNISIKGATVVCNINSDVKTLLRELSLSSIPHSSLNNGSIVRLHPLIQQVANKMLYLKLDKKEVDDIYKNASDYFIKEDRIIEAIEAQVKTGDWNTTLYLISEQWFQLASVNGLARVNDWLNSLPKEAKTDPVYIDLKSRNLIQEGDSKKLLKYLATNLNEEYFKNDTSRLINLKVHYHWARINTDINTEYDKMLTEFTSMIKNGESIKTDILTGVQVVLSIAAYMELRINTGIDHAKKALHLIGESSPEYRIGIQDNLAVLYHTKGQTIKATELLMDGINYYKKNNSYYGMSLRMFNLAWITTVTIGYHNALEIIQEGRDIIKKYQIIDAYDQIFANRYEGIIRWYLGEHDKSIRLLKLAMEQSEQNTKEYLETALMLDFCMIMSGQNTLTVDKKLIPPRATKKETRLVYLGIISYLSAKDKKSDELSIAAREIYKTSSECRLLPWSTFACFALSYYYYLKDDIECSKEKLRVGLELLEKINWSSYPMVNELFNRFIFVKAVRYNIHPNTARKLIESDIHTDLRTPFIDEIQKEDLTAKEVRNLIQAAVDFNIKGLSDHLSVNQYVDESEIKGVVNNYIDQIKSIAPSPLKITTLGTFEIILEGKPVKFIRKSSQRLFQWLLTIYPKSIHKEILIDYFWSDVPIKNGYSSLRTTIKDLRKSLDPYGDLDQNAYIFLERDQYSLNLPDNSYADCLLFLDNISVAEQIYRSLDNQNKKQFENKLKSALLLYEGEYLPTQLYEEFAVEQREIINNKYVKASYLLARFLIDSNRSSEAITILRDALKIDNLWSDGIYLLIKTLSKSGQKVEAMKTYRTYEQRLKKELQVEPDAKLTDLFHHLSS